LSGRGKKGRKGSYSPWKKGSIGIFSEGLAPKEKRKQSADVLGVQERKKKS